MIDDSDSLVETTPISRNGRPIGKARVGVSIRILKDLAMALYAADNFAQLRASTAESHSTHEREPRPRRRATSRLSPPPAETNGHTTGDEVLPRR